MSAINLATLIPLVLGVVFGLLFAIDAHMIRRLQNLREKHQLDLEARDAEWRTLQRIAQQHPEWLAAVDIQNADGPVQKTDVLYAGGSGTMPIWWRNPQTRLEVKSTNTDHGLVFDHIGADGEMVFAEKQASQ